MSKWTKLGLGTLIVTVTVTFCFWSFERQGKPILKNQELLSRVNLSALEMPFVQNNGQMDSEVCFYAHTFAGPVFVSKQGEIVYSLKGATIKESIVGGNVNPIKGEGETVTKVNYLKGRDPLKWRKNIPSYHRVDMGAIYEGVDFKLKAYGRNVEKLFFVGPRGNPQKIRVRLDGLEDLKIDQDGALVAVTEAGEVRFTRPMAYQMIEGERTEVQVSYWLEKVRDTFTYGFEVGQYSKRHALVIDPLVASTFLGGGGDERGEGIALDPDGNVFVVGWTSSDDFPSISPEGVDNQFNNLTDIFVVRLRPDLAGIEMATYLGGNGHDHGNDIAVASNGDVYLTGWTSSSDFPPTTNPDPNQAGATNVQAFAAKLDRDLTTILAFSFLGGAGDDRGHKIAIKADGEIMVMGNTHSGTFSLPTNVVPVDGTLGGFSDVFIVKLNANDLLMNGFTYLGGSGVENASSLVTGSDGSIFVAGMTNSDTDFPQGTSAGYDERSSDFVAGEDRIFIAKFNSNLVLNVKTFLGKGESKNKVNSLALALNDDVYVTGGTSDNLFPITSVPGTNPMDSSFNGPTDNSVGFFDVFISKLNSGLDQLIASTFLGGSDREHGTAIAVDPNGIVTVTGLTTRLRLTDPLHFPVTATQPDGQIGLGDAFVAQFDSGLTALFYSNLLGGRDLDLPLDVVLNEGNVYLTGLTSSTGFRTLQPADVQPPLGIPDQVLEGTSEGFVAKYALNRSPSNLIATAVSSSGIMLFWNDNSTNEEQFSIERQESPCMEYGYTWRKIKSVPANTRQFKATKLQPNREYSFRVRAFDPAMSLGYSNCASATTGPAGSPKSPSDLVVIATGSDTVKVKWKDESRIETHFRIRQYQKGSLMLEQFTYPNETERPLTASNNQQASKPQYSYSVRACRGPLDKTAVCSPETRRAFLPKQPLNLSADTVVSIQPGNTLESSIRTQWGASARSQAYIVRRRLEGCGRDNQGRVATTGWSRVGFVRSPKTFFLDETLGNDMLVGYQSRGYYTSGGWPYAQGFSMWSNCDEDITLPANDVPPEVDEPGEEE